MLQKQETASLVGTIIEMQPRMSSGTGGKSSDEITYELCEMIQSKVIEFLDIDNASRVMFEVTDDFCR